MGYLAMAGMGRISLTEYTKELSESNLSPLGL